MYPSEVSQKIDLKKKEEGIVEMPPSASVPSMAVATALPNKIEMKTGGDRQKMISRMIADGYNLMNLGAGKNPVLTKWQERTSEVLAEAFNPKDSQVSLRLGTQKNGRYIISIDFDNFGKKTSAGRAECPLTMAIYEDYRAHNRLDGMFSSSTEGNFNVLVDVTDVPEILEMCSTYPKNHWDSECVQFLVKQDAQQVIPPTATGNKRTAEKVNGKEVMVPGKPRKFLNDIPFYQMTAEDTFMIDFFKKHYKKPEPVRPIRPVRPARAEEAEVADEWTELLYNVIKNEADRGYVISYNQWQGIGTILKHNNFPFKVFKDWHMMCPLNSDDGSAEHYWEHIKGSGFSIYALQGIAKKVNPSGYKEWFMKHKKFLTLKVLAKGENDVAQFMAPLMLEHLVYTGKQWYRNTGMLWLPSKDAPVATIATQLQNMIDLSRESLLAKKNATEDEEEKKKMEESLKQYSKLYTIVGGAGYTSHISRMYKEYLFDENFEEKIDKTLYKIVYKDGIYDMRTKTFRKGIFPYEYITKTLPYCYERGEPEVKTQILRALLRICNNNKDQLEYYLATFGYALTGDASREQYMWYMCGQGAGNGKSSVLEALTAILPIYCISEDREAFYKNSTKLHKAVGTWAGARVLWVNELENDKKVNESLFKHSCDGTTITFPKMYGENEKMLITFKLFLVSNWEFNIQMDEGVKRRFKHEQFNSKFDIEDDTPEDEVGCRFRKDPDFGKWLQANKHSLLEIIYERSYQYTLTGLPKCPPEWEEKKKETVANLNEFESKLRTLCVLGENETAWNEYLVEALEVKDSAEIKKEMKRLGLYHKYDSQFKEKKMKGLHRGLRLKTQAEQEEEQKVKLQAMEGVTVASLVNPNPDYDYDELI
jgi:phage/plasmid-associated DNA primase